jgi:hypothetical protein
VGGVVVLGVVVGSDGEVVFETTCGAGTLAGGVFVEVDCPVMPTRIRKTTIAPPNRKDTSLRDLSFILEGFTRPTMRQTIETSNRRTKKEDMVF